VQELEALLALCKAAPFVESVSVATPLLERLSSHLPAVFAQTLSPSPKLGAIEPSPHEVLSYHLTSAILTLGHRHGLQAKATAAVTQYVRAWTGAAQALSTDQFDEDNNEEKAEHGEVTRVMTQSLSLLGFLSAAAEHADFWSAYDRLQFLEHVRAALSEKFLVVFETALSVVRNARSHQHGLREWKRIVRHYAANARPLGAMILHDSFLKLVVASASSLVERVQRIPGHAILEHLKSMENISPAVRDTAQEALAEGLTKIAIEEMERLDNDLDYLQRVGSAWQQRQASSAKAKALTTYLCCTIYDQDVANAELLAAWLDNVLNDPTQSADHDLASTVLKSMVILAKASPPLASTLGRSLPRVIVQANFDRRTTSVAADALAAVLSLLPQDVIITTLYSLGNIISTGPAVDRNVPMSPTTNGTSKESRTGGVYNHEHGSAISLSPSDVEEPHYVHTTVVETVVSVARSCKDEKITALALSMLVQKVGRASKVVDAKIITDAALLGIHSPPGEFKSLLKLYSKLAHDALLKDDSTLLQAVSAVCLTLHWPLLI
jgi:phosphatidylinositol 4-kinase